jgi:broad specificity phosphatase PhoE
MGLEPPWSVRGLHIASPALLCYNARMPCPRGGDDAMAAQEGEREMGVFGSKRRAPAGRHFGRDLEYHEHAGWRKLVLVRHGQTDYNVKHQLPGQLPGIPLNGDGRREAQATAAALRDLPLTAIVASPLERTMETAGYLNAGRGLAIWQDRDLLDTDYGRFSGQCWDELDKQDRTWQRFTADQLRAPNGVESLASVQKRAVRAAERWRHAEDAGEWVALVTHADLVKLIVAHYLGMPLARAPLIYIDNASAALLAYHPDPQEPPTLLCFNWSSPTLWLNAARRG